jgi:hypothetical protein
MLGMVFALPAVFGLFLWLSYRTDAARARAGQGFDPAGKRRWSRSPDAELPPPPR